MEESAYVEPVGLFILHRLLAIVRDHYFYLLVPTDCAFGIEMGNLC